MGERRGGEGRSGQERRGVGKRGEEWGGEGRGEKARIGQERRGVDRRGEGWAGEGWGGQERGGVDRRGVGWTGEGGKSTGEEEERKRRAQNAHNVLLHIRVCEMCCTHMRPVYSLRLCNCLPQQTDPVYDTPCQKFPLDPSMVRYLGGWVGKIRMRYMNSQHGL